MSEVKVRIAPSPTGDPHIGTAYIALFNYVFAKNQKGKFVLRIEDTDQVRRRADSEGMIMDALRWTGIQWDEGPDIGGPCGPYRQSERKELHRQRVFELIERGQAYRCFCTPQRLDELRKSQQAQHLQPKYDMRCRHVDAKESKDRADKGEAFTIRMKMPTSGKTVISDRLRGSVEFENEGVDDQILLKSDGFPTYHLANVVDDHEMKITHVIRGEEWLSSTPKHVVLYEAFGWKAPEFIHLPLLRNADKSKISKRRNPTSINYYRRKGILPYALLNFLALMGWNFGDNREVFSMDEMIKDFSWERFTLGGPVFDLQKLGWMNSEYVKKMSDKEIATHLRNEVFREDYLLQIIPLIKERIQAFEEFIGVSDFFFSGDLDYSKLPLVQKDSTPKLSVEVLNLLMENLEAAQEWTMTSIKTAFDETIKQAEPIYAAQNKKFKAKDLYMPSRLVLTGSATSTPLMETVVVLGKEMVRRRIFCAVQFLKTLPES